MVPLITVRRSIEAICEDHAPCHLFSGTGIECHSCFLRSISGSPSETTGHEIQNKSEKRRNNVSTKFMGLIIDMLSEHKFS